MTKVKSTLESLISEGFTPLQIALELKKLQEDVTECPFCNTAEKPCNMTPKFVKNYKRLQCRNCLTQWQTTKFKFGKEIV
jgi:hypothetical protein